MNLRNLSDNNLLRNTLDLAQREREVTLEVLHHLREVERRSLFATLAYPSLFEYTVKELRYSASAAQRRIASMRLLKELPEIEKKVESGELSLSTLAQAQVFFRQENSSLNIKREVLSSLENKSSREVERELVSRSGTPERLMPEKIRAVSATHSELKVLVEVSFMAELEELRNLLGSKIPFASAKDILAYAIKYTLNEVRPKAPKHLKKLVEKSQPVEIGKLPVGTNQNNSKQKSTRYIPVEVRRSVWKRDQGQCSFINLVTKRRCCSKHGLELDHVFPHALGGKQTIQNLRLRCRTHNHLAAVQYFGQQKMASYVPRIE